MIGKLTLEYVPPAGTTIEATEKEHARPTGILRLYADQDGDQPRLQQLWSVFEPFRNSEEWRDVPTVIGTQKDPASPEEGTGG